MSIIRITILTVFLTLSISLFSPPSSTLASNIGGHNINDSGDTAGSSINTLELLSFSATENDNGIEIRWTTTAETNLAGFLLYRSHSNNLHNAYRISLQMILSAGVQGGEYIFVDLSALPSENYYYWLQEIGSDGTGAVYGPIINEPQNLESDPAIIIGSQDESTIQVASDNQFELPIQIDNSSKDIIGAITLAIHYDSSLMEPIDCVLNIDILGACNMSVESNLITLSGISLEGISGDLILVSIIWDIFKGSVGETTIDIDVETLVDPTGNSIDGYTIRDQHITITPQGDVDCDGQRSVVDGLFILQQNLELLTGTDQCKPDQQQEGGFDLSACDVNGDEVCNPIDALFILQCNAGVPNLLCPDSTTFSNPENTRLQSSPELSEGQSASAATLRLEATQISEGNPFTVTVSIDSIAELGTLTASLGYDPTQFQPVVCQPIEHPGIRSGGCNLKDGAGRIRFNAIMPTGKHGLLSLAEITFMPSGTATNVDELDLMIHLLTDSDGRPLDGTVAGNRHLIYLPTIIY